MSSLIFRVLLICVVLTAIGSLVAIALDENSPDQVGGSLKRLKLDYVDLYLIHFPVPARNKSWTIMEGLHAAGRTKSIGVSNFTIRHLDELLAKTKTVPAVNQVEIHPFLSQRELRQYCASKQMVVEAYSPLTHGKRLDDRGQPGQARLKHAQPGPVERGPGGGRPGESRHGRIDIEHRSEAG